MLLPELNRLRGHRNEMGGSLIFFFSTQWNELLLGIKKKVTFISPFTLLGSAVLPRRKPVISALWMEFTRCLYLLLLYNVLLLITQILYRCYLLGKPQVTQGCCTGL